MVTCIYSHAHKHNLYTWFTLPLIVFNSLKIFCLWPVLSDPLLASSWLLPTVSTGSFCGGDSTGFCFCFFLILLIVRQPLWMLTNWWLTTLSRVQMWMVKCNNEGIINWNLVVLKITRILYLLLLQYLNKGQSKDQTLLYKCIATHSSIYMLSALHLAYAAKFWLHTVPAIIHFLSVCLKLLKLNLIV